MKSNHILVKMKILYLKMKYSHLIKTLIYYWINTVCLILKQIFLWLPVVTVITTLMIICIFLLKLTTELNLNWKECNKSKRKHRMKKNHNTVNWNLMAMIIWIQVKNKKIIINTCKVTKIFYKMESSIFN